MKASGRSASLLVAPLALLVVAVVAGCQGQPAGQGSAQIAMSEYHFTPNRIDATAGMPVTIELVNRGTERHDLSFGSLHMPGLNGVEAILQPGETRTITLTFDEPGTHTFICSLPGHAAAGMTGAVFVSP